MRSSDESEDGRANAQDVVYEAMDAMGSDLERAATLCREALSLDADCVDARCLLAQLEELSVDEYTEAMREAVAAGRRSLGEAAFAEFAGHFWGFHETRPFMRAMAGLAEGLREDGERDGLAKAIGVWEEMLELNPGDNQGVRYELLGAYLAARRYDDAEALLDRYSDEDSAVMVWGRLLLEAARGEDENVDRRLAEARAANPFVELFVTGRKRRPRIPPEFYGIGDENEAVVCMNTLWEAFRKHPKVKKWIKERVEAAG